MRIVVLSKVGRLWTFAVFVAFFLTAELCHAQAASIPGTQATEDYTLTQVGPHSRVWGNSAGQTVTEIATGLNYWDGNQWVPSVPGFAPTPDGSAFVADQVQDPTRVAKNLNCEGAVSVATPDNVPITSTPFAIGLYDAATGKSAIIATITNTTGVQSDANTIVYDRALVGGGFAASIVYLIDAASFHQDVVFTGFNPTFNPTNWGFAESSTNTLEIEIYTEFYSFPQALFLTNVLFTQEDPNIRASMVSPDLVDLTLDFGDYVFGPGRAYTTADNVGGVRVMKDFITTGGRTFLIESVPYQWIAPQLHALPPVAANFKSSVKPTSRRSMLASATVPRLKQVKQAKLEPAKKSIPARELAFTGARPSGLDVDYVVTVSSTVKPTLFTADTTYFVSGTVVESSAVTMESAVFKYPKGSTGTIEIESTLTMNTTNYRPVIFTAADDNTIGTMLGTNIWSGYTGSPGTNRYGAYALNFEATGNYSLNNLRFVYQNYPIYFFSDTTGQTLNVSHAQFVESVNGIYIDGGEGGGIVFGGGLPPSGATTMDLNVNNCLMSAVLDPFESINSVTVDAILCNCTIDSCYQLAAQSGGSAVFKVTNSIMSNISSNSTTIASLTGGDNCFYSCPTFGSAYTNITSNPYESFGAGNYYLPSTSPLLTLGTTNVGAALLAQLQMKTTEAPLTLTNTISNYTVLSPVVQRDTAGTALGVHYDPIDYFCAFAVSNTTLLLTNGVSLAYYDNLGLWLQDDSQLVSQGTPNYRNYFAFYGLVQEQPTNLWGASNAIAQVVPIVPLPTNSANKPSIYMRLTTICAPQGETNLLNTADSNQVVSSLALRDCEIYGAGANWLMTESNNEPIIGLTNNVFHRVSVAITNNATVYAYNNLFYGTTNTNAFQISVQRRSGTSSNIVENNVFDGVTASLTGTVGYNAYLHGGTNTTIEGTDLVTNLTWVAGPLGAYYQPSTSPLLNNGSTYATNLGLYHYTVETNTSGGNEIVEGTNIVSRGYHYVALGANGLPLDTNGDGIPDYLEDANGNGIVDSGEIDWLLAGDLGLTVIITQPANNTTIP